MGTKMTDTSSVFIVFGLLVLLKETGAANAIEIKTNNAANDGTILCGDDSTCQPSFTAHDTLADVIYDVTGENSIPEEEEEETEYSEEPADIAELILNCIFSSVPYVGGKWLTNLLRRAAADDTLMTASYSFVDGGKLLGRIMGLDSTSQTITFFDRLDACFEVDAYQSEHRKNGAEGFNPAMKDHRLKRSYKDKNKGYGKDSLIGFSILGILIVGAMIAYLIYLLT
ncbi:uncharacterized protein LOC135197553 [Macrobrachium nipponense]|uniref:uncharacterized protein LOC135197553 n=1 Tax=Macrobrachium nipponense TaxID=159736 RepID=UPI0030C89E4A